MEYHEIVKKLVGPIKPVGSSHLDDVRMENLKVMCNLVQNLLYDISDVADENKARGEHSMREAGLFADAFLKKALESQGQP